MALPTVIQPTSDQAWAAIVSTSNFTYNSVTGYKTQYLAGALTGEGLTRSFNEAGESATSLEANSAIPGVNDAAQTSLPGSPGYDAVAEANATATALLSLQDIIDGNIPKTTPGDWWNLIKRSTTNPRVVEFRTFPAGTPGDVLDAGFDAVLATIDPNLGV